MNKKFLGMTLAIILILAMGSTALAAISFDDVPTDAWYYEDVMFAAEEGLVNGKTATSYDPNASLTTAEAIKLAAAMHQLDAEGEVSLVNGNPWYMTYVNYAKNHSIIAKDYDWNTTISRGEFMDIFARALPKAELNAINNVDDGAIPDVAMDHQYADEIYLLYRAGILAGSDEARNAKTADDIKRSEVATIVARMMDDARRVKFSLEADGFRITSQPEDMAVASGADAVLEIKVADGATPYNYQWQQKDGSTWKDLADSSTVDGALEAKLTLENITSATTVRCLVTDNQNAKLTSSEADITIVAPDALTIDIQTETNIAAYAGDYIEFGVEGMGGSAPYTYLWEQAALGSTNYVTAHSDTNAPFTPEQGSSTNRFYDFYVSDRSYDFQLRCTVTDSEGNSVSSKPFMVEAPPLSLDIQAENTIAADVGDYIEFGVEGMGGRAPYTYLWEQAALGSTNYVTAHSDINAPFTPEQGSSTNRVYDFYVSDRSYDFQLRCTVTDSAGNTFTSEPFKLDYKSLAVKDVTPVKVIAAVGDYIEFGVEGMGGSAPYTYLWEQAALGSTNYVTAHSDTNAPFTPEQGSSTNRVYDFYVSDRSYDFQLRCTVTDSTGAEVYSSVFSVEEY